MTKRSLSEVKEKLKLLVIDNSDEIDNLDVNTLEVIAMAPMVLECPDAECKLGVDGAKLKTTELEAGMAMEMLRFHVQLNHG